MGVMATRDGKELSLGWVVGIVSTNAYIPALRP
jgi:hypothetical protein